MVSTVINGGTPYKYNGKTYYFNTGGCSGGIQEACAAGMNVTVQVMLDAAAYNADPSLVAKEARSSGHPFYTWNTKDKAAREKWKQCSVSLPSLSAPMTAMFPTGFSEMR